METTTFSTFRALLKQKLDKVTDNHDVLVVNRRGDKDVVVMSLKDYNSLQETLYLLSSEKNAQHLFESIDQLKAKKIIQKKLKDL